MSIDALQQFRKSFAKDSGRSRSTTSARWPPSTGSTPTNASTKAAPTSSRERGLATKRFFHARSSHKQILLMVTFPLLAGLLGICSIKISPVQPTANSFLGTRLGQAIMFNLVQLTYRGIARRTVRMARCVNGTSVT